MALAAARRVVLVVLLAVLLLRLLLMLLLVVSALRALLGLLPRLLLRLSFCKEVDPGERMKKGRNICYFVVIPILG
jgi:hypothetical protein